MTEKLIDRFQKSTPLYGGNGAFIEDYYEQYLANPDSVSEDWARYFKGLNGSGGHDVAHGPIRESFARRARESRGSGRAEVLAPEAAQKQAGVLRLINYYRVRGHQAAHLDPLGLAIPPAIPDLDPGFHGLGEADMDTVFNTGSLAAEDNLPLRRIIEIVRKVYTRNIGAEYMYLTDTPQKRWIQRRLEAPVDKAFLTREEKVETLRQLTAAEGIEKYLHTRYVGQKRFSLEGGDSMIPLLDEVLRVAASHKMDEIVIGMAHRGRLNVLVNILGKSPADLFDEFEGNYDLEKLAGSGDVKYHMGFSTDVEINDARVHMVLAFNPSHLEIVNPVVEGSVKARQVRRKDFAGKTVLPVLIHGDAAFAGQGIIMETLQLSQAKGYSTGGTIHIIVNNQVGFTTDNPIEAEAGEVNRSSLYCTDIAKMLESPVFHVNADDPEAVVFVTKLAMDFRAEFNKDVIIDLVCYRRHGHNEADEPAVTQPLMYKKIRSHPTTRELYAKRLAEEGVMSEEESSELLDAYRQGLEEGRNLTRQTLGMVGNQHTVDWSKFEKATWDEPVNTGMPIETIRRLNDRLLALPEGFELHARVKRIMDDRRKMAGGAAPLDWGFAETMAYAGLIDDGYGIRLSGQDCGRGTFFHRHAEVHATDGRSWCALSNLNEEGPTFLVNNCLLSEEGVLGFEYGYATAEPQTQVIWEAQFGDFANVAQVVMDQFISSGQAKWGRYCGLTMFLPHGYEGQGPEHSSARLERYLQLCAENNMQVCVPSTPAQMFHMIRRQMLRAIRLPLVVMTPKSLLRHKLSVSTLDDLSDGSFQLIIDEIDDIDPAAVKRLVVCSGKVYFDLLQKRRDEGMTDVAIVRLEQLYPFPKQEYAALFEKYANATDIVWCQEEPENQGAWYSIKHRLQLPIEDDRHVMRYATRKGAASTAVGYPKVHAIQQEEVVMAALTGGAKMKGR